MEYLRKAYVFLIDTVQTLLLVFVVFLIVYLFIFKPFQVTGDSMKPNFLDSEYILTNVISLRFESPKLGDVIVFKAPPDPQRDYIKRIIGEPGDTLLIRDGQVYRNGKLLDESSFIDSSEITRGGAFLKENESIKVPQNSYFVMGDNRLGSSDSREWGFVPKEAIIGRSFFVYWPISKVKIVKNPFN